MEACCRCGNRHVDSLIFATPGFMFLFQQDFEQWCDENLNDWQLEQIRSLPLMKPAMSSLFSIMSMVNSF